MAQLGKVNYGERKRGTDSTMKVKHGVVLTRIGRNGDLFQIQGEVSFRCGIKWQIKGFSEVKGESSLLVLPLVDVLQESKSGIVSWWGLNTRRPTNNSFFH